MACDLLNKVQNEKISTRGTINTELVVRSEMNEKAKNLEIILERKSNWRLHD